MNGDKIDDIAVANRIDSSISILRGNGDGTFQVRQNFATGASPQSIAAGDLNGDGRADLIHGEQPRRRHGEHSAERR